VREAVSGRQDHSASKVRDYFSRTFSSLRTRNYRLYFIGQGISMTGTFMQGVAQPWLVYTLTGSATAVGAVSALQFGPVLLLGPYGGILADRFSKRRLMFITQAAAGLLALTMWALVVTHLVQLWMVFAIAGVLGIVNSLDNPARQTFVYELVGRGGVGNAVTLNSTELNLSRVIGPAIAGILIATTGVASCFLINAVSFGAVLVSLWMMRPGELVRAKLVPKAKGQLREGFRYVARTPILRDALVMMLLIGTLTFEFQVSLLALAHRTFSAGAVGYSMLTAGMGIGAVAGGLVLAGLHRPGKRMLIGGALAFGATTALVAVSPSIAFAVAGMVLVGASSIAFTSVTNTTLQLNSDPSMRGRVMSLWSTAFLGSTVIGAPAIGWVADRFSPQWALAIGALAAVAAGVYGLLDVGRRAGGEAPLPSEAEPEPLALEEQAPGLPEEAADPA
jgi:MFS family permease